MNHDEQNSSKHTDMHERIEQRLISNVFYPFLEQGVKQTEVDSSPLVDKELDLQGQYDRQLTIRTLQQKEPNLQSIQLYANKQLDFNQYDNHPQFDRQFAFQPLHDKQPQLTNTSIRPHLKLNDSQLGKQQEYDRQALVADIDRNQPDIIQIKRRQEQQIEAARQKAVDNDLKIGKKQESIKIKSVEDVYVEIRVYQNQGVLPLQNKYDFEEESTIAQFQIPIINKRTKDSQTINIPNNTIKLSTTSKCQETDYDEDWQINIRPTSFSRRAQKVTNNNSEQTESNRTEYSHGSSQKVREYKLLNRQSKNRGKYFQGNPLVQYAKATSKSKVKFNY